MSPDNSDGSLENWTLIAAGTIDLPLQRSIVGPIVSFDNDQLYSDYRIVFPTI
jgi:hypothetical protein